MSSLFEKDTILAALQKGEIQLQGQFVNSSNYTFLGMLNHEELHLPVVYKPTRGERPLWDFPPHTLTRREVAAFVVSEALGWELVPPTIYRRRKTPLGPGSLQLYIEHDPEYHYFRFSEADRQRLRPVVLFDLLVNNADRKGGHMIVDKTGHLWLIDHGTCFNEVDKLRTVIWDFAGQEIPAGMLADLERFGRETVEGSPLYQELAGLLKPAEVGWIRQRLERLIEIKTFPLPDQLRRSYPWPPV
jgi:hypothetical protein